MQQAQSQSSSSGPRHQGQSSSDGSKHGSTTSIREYLINAKTHLQTQLRRDDRQGRVNLVIGNESADLDSITCALVYGYTQSASRADDLLIPITNIPASDLALRPELTALLKYANASPSDLITLDDLGGIPLPLASTNVWLVDHNALQGTLGKHYSDAVCGVIDHHDDEGKVASDVHPRIIEKSGSCSSLVTNYCHDAWESMPSGRSSGNMAGASAQVAKLALGSILIDTYNLESGDKVKDHDRKAVDYLEAKIQASGDDYDRDTFFEKINSAKSDIDGLSLPDILRKDYKQWSEGVLTLGISSVVKPVDYLRDKAAKADSDFIKTLVDFAKARKLHLYAVMAAYTAESGSFARQLLLLSLEDGKPTAALHRFTRSSSDELQLQTADLQTFSGTERVPFCGFYDQKNITASRKQVGPMLRQAMGE
ncbi:hypothetical protein LTR08_007268 [Meristemomyces frigidus]|nr:hypothetical protein LTR08_007268 [Meristemomyces frigidus]